MAKEGKKTPEMGKTDTKTTPKRRQNDPKWPKVAPQKAKNDPKDSQKCR